MLIGTSSDISQAIKIRQSFRDKWKVEDVDKYRLIQRKLYLIESASWFIQSADCSLDEIVEELLA
jgi:acetolactate synthase small subunit